MFPRLVERNINGLLDEAEPNALRKLQIYRAIKNNGLTRGGVEEFLRNLEEFFSHPRAEREKSQFDQFLERPMSHEVYALFHLDFRTAAIPDESLERLANWAYNLIRVSKKTSGAFMSQDVLFRTFRAITSPHRHEKSEQITFADFCAAWKRTVLNLFGRVADPDFDSLMKELEWLDRQSQAAPHASVETEIVPGVYLASEEVAWLNAVRDSAFKNDEIPKYPAAAASQKQAIRDLERVIALYTISRTSMHPEIIAKRERIRATLIDRCDSLLGEDRRLVG